MNIEDPEAFTVETLVSAVATRLKGMDGSEVRNAIGFLTELDDLEDAVTHAKGVVNGWVRQQQQAKTA